MNETYELQIRWGIFYVIRTNENGTFEIASGDDIASVLQQATSNGMPPVTLPLLVLPT